MHFAFAQDLYSSSVARRARAPYSGSLARSVIIIIFISSAQPTGGNVECSISSVPRMFGVSIQLDPIVMHCPLSFFLIIYERTKQERGRKDSRSKKERERGRQTECCGWGPWTVRAKRKEPR